ncbi:MAG: NfeD family protein [Gemmatimonadota bacterium]
MARTRRYIAAAALMLCGLALAATPEAPRRVLQVEIDGIIGPQTADLVTRSIDRAAAQGMKAVILRMDTPGGLDTSMREIIKAILAAPLPVITYVAPQGARAASAGTYILYASHIAAMAPATNLGAATPVSIGIGGEQPRPLEKGSPAEKEKSNSDKGAKSGSSAPDESIPVDAMTAKAVNDAAAYIRSLAQLRGRNADFAEQAVRRARSMAAQEALKAGVIDLIAPDVPSLLNAIDGRTVVIGAGKVVLDTAGAQVETLSPDWRYRLLALLSNPTVAVLLMMIGIYGLFYEFTSPGFVLPGVAGAICLLLALYAFHLMPVNWAGVGLIALGMGLLIAEAFIGSFGVLGVGGVIALVLGGVLLIDVDLPGYGVPLWFIFGMAATSALFVFGVSALVARSRRRPVVAGREEMVGASGEVVDASDGETWARVHGEIWRVRAEHPLRVGSRVRVHSVDGLTLVVRPEHS